MKLHNEVELKRFSERGMLEVRQAMERLRDNVTTTKGSQGVPIPKEEVDMLAGFAFKEELLEAVDLENSIDTQKEFRNRYDMSRYLSGIVTGSQHENDDGLWTWISMLYITQLLSPRKDGQYLLGREYRYLPDNSRLRYYRHLARTGWSIYRQHDQKSRLFLSVPCHVHSDFVEQSQKDEVRSNPNLIDLCLKLFYDDKKQELKSNVAGSVDMPGSFRRLVSVVAPQLYMNFDLYDMSADNIIDKLPIEFQKWQA